MSDQPKMRTAEDALRDPRPGDRWRDDGGVPLFVSATGNDATTGRRVVVYRSPPDHWEHVVLMKSFKRRIRNAEVLHVAQEGGGE